MFAKLLYIETRLKAWLCSEYCVLNPLPLPLTLPIPLWKPHQIVLFTIGCYRVPFLCRRFLCVEVLCLPFRLFFSLLSRNNHLSTKKYYVESLRGKCDCGLRITWFIFGLHLVIPNGPSITLRIQITIQCTLLFLCGSHSSLSVSVPCIFIERILFGSKIRQKMFYE